MRSPCGFAAIVLGSGVVGDDGGTETAGTRDLPAATDETTATERQTKRGPATYTIKANDTLSGIAARSTARRSSASRS